MKTLKLTSALAIILAILFSFTACKKGNEEGPDGGSSSGYDFKGDRYTISAANEKHLGDDIYLEFTSGTGDYLQIGFANTDVLVEKELTYHGDRFVGYDPQSHFWATEVGIEGVNTAINGGTVNITKDGDNYKIVFNLTTDEGDVKGEYIGKPTVTN